MFKKKKKFFPIFFTSLFGVCGAFLLVSLGVWQLERHEWKQEILKKIRQSPSQKVVSVLEVTPSTLKGFEFRHVRVQGTWKQFPPVFVIGRMHNGKMGYHLFGVVDVTGGDPVLVNFGWVGHKEFTGGEIRAADFLGRVRLTQPPSWFSPKHISEKREFSSVDVSAIGDFLGVKLAPYYVDSIREDIGQQPFPVPNKIKLPDNHFGYAMTWFALAFFWSVGFLSLIWRQRRKRKFSLALH